MTARTVAIIQARMGSTRLPNKVMLPLLGEPMLTRVMRRIARAKTIDEVVVATTPSPDDDAIVDLAAKEGWPVERGSETDLLDRFLTAARAQAAEVVVRVTSDCPMIDPGVIDRTVIAFRAAGVDYANNTIPPRTYPRGLDTEVFTMAALERAGREDRDPAWREHATPYIYKHPERFRILRVPVEDDLADRTDLVEMRWSIDTPEDLRLIERIYETLGRDDFTWREALAVVDANPSWGTANSTVTQKLVPPEKTGVTNGMARHVLLRADATTAVGTGHFMRCRTLAEALVGRGWRATIVTRDLPDALAADLTAAGIELSRLTGATSEAEEPAAIARSTDRDATLVIGDDYRLGPIWWEGLRYELPAAVLMAIDDLADRPLPVDLVLNQNLGANPDAYAGLAAPGARILAGPAYALLRPEFAALRARGRVRDGRVQRLIIFISGGDTSDVTRRAVEALGGPDGPGIPLDVVVGAAYPNLGGLRELVDRQPATELHVNTDAMADLMDRADLAVGAASSASWERCALGLPAVLVTVADNQLAATDLLVEAGAAVAIGWHEVVSSAEIERTVRALVADPARVAAMSVAAAAVTDGRGTKRVADAIEQQVRVVQEAR